MTRSRSLFSWLIFKALRGGPPIFLKKRIPRGNCRLPRGIRYVCTGNPGLADCSRAYAAALPNVGLRRSVFLKYQAKSAAAVNNDTENERKMPVSPHPQTKPIA